MWLEDVRSHAEESVSIVLVGNQLDLCRDDDDDDEESQEASTEEDQATEDAEEENESNDKESDSKQRKSHTSNPSDTAKKPKKKRREVSTKEAKEFAEKEGIMFVETSAKTGQVSKNSDLSFCVRSFQLLFSSLLVSHSSREPIEPCLCYSIVNYPPC